MNGICFLTFMPMKGEYTTNIIVVELLNRSIELTILTPLNH